MQPASAPLYTQQSLGSLPFSPDPSAIELIVVAESSS